MSCISTTGRCTKCCEVIHIPAKVWPNLLKDPKRYTDGRLLRKYWTPISKRRAKKINPYIFTLEDNKAYLKTAGFFTCRALEVGVGCKIRDTENHPNVCKIFKGGYDYSPTCKQDINIIARSGG
jgi:hypothetical protein